MIDVVSHIDGELTHRIVSYSDTKDHKDKNWSPDSAMMQVSSKRLKKGEFYKPHIHIPKVVPDLPTGECWIVMEGEIRMTLYDIDETELMTVALYPKDCGITFRGGHRYECMTDEAFIYEPKSGDFQGSEKDKKYITTEGK